MTDKNTEILRMPTNCGNSVPRKNENPKNQTIQLILHWVWGRAVCCYRINILCRTMSQFVKRVHCKMNLFTARRYASTIYAVVVRLSVFYKPALYQNG